MDEVETAQRQRVHPDIVATQLQVRRSRSRNPIGVEIGGQNMAGSAHPLTHESRNRATARADLEAAPAGTDPQPVELAARYRVVQGFQAGETRTRLGSGIVEQVPRPRRNAIHAPSRIHICDDRTNGWFATGVIPEVSAETFSPTRILLDREDDLAALDNALHQAVTGAGRVLLIEGPPGIGKTVLLDELRRRARTLHIDVLTARAGELERGYAFGVVRQLLEARLTGAGGEERTRLLAGAARLAEPVFSAVTGVDEGDDLAFATLHGLYWLVVNMAEQRPLMLAVDDVHWADEPSLRFLLHLAHRLPGLPVVLALTMRTGVDKHHHNLSLLLLEAQPPILRPQPLSEAAVTTLVKATLGADTGPALCRACAKATGGNPFLLSELLGELRRDARPADRIDPATVLQVVPERVAAAVLLRVSRLDPAAPALARSVAVLGDAAGLVNCARLANLEPAKARTLASALTELAVLEPGEPLRFVHPIVRTVIYDDTDATERNRLHAGAARLLTKQYADPRGIAVHLLARDPSGDRETVTLLRDAARRALTSGAPDTATALLRRALDEPPQERDRSQILFELGTAEHEIGDPAAPHHLREAGETACDPAARARAVIALAWTTHTDPARQREQIPLYEHVGDAVRDHDRELALELEAARLGALLFNPDLPIRFEDEAQRFRDLPAQSAAECLLLSFVARSALTAGHTVAEAGDLAERSASHPALTSQGGHPLWRTNVTFCLIAAARYDIAEQLLSRAVRHAERTGSPQWTARALWLRGLTRHRHGDLRGAEADLRAAVSAQGLTYIHFRYTVLFPLIDVLTDQGRVDEADALLVDNGLDGALAPVPLAIGSHLVRGRLRAAQGDLTTARTDLEEALRGLKSSRGLIPWDHDARIALVPVLHALGDHNRALDLADEALNAARAAQSQRAIGGALRVRGLVHGGKEGLDMLQQAVDTLAASPANLWRAEALVDLGSALRRDGQRTTARPLLREGMERAHRCAATALADRATDELRATGARPRRRAGTGVDALTASERRVAELAATGISNKEIAQALFVTLRTVELHLSNSYSKLEIHSRQELARALQS
ncbi:ATP-binding protein [Rhodococcus aetherivorans]